MAIRTLPSRAIADASIQAVDIASNSISKSKIDADTRLGLQNDSIILDATDGAGAGQGNIKSIDIETGNSAQITLDPEKLDLPGAFTAVDYEIRETPVYEVKGGNFAINEIYGVDVAEAQTARAASGDARKYKPASSGWVGITTYNDSDGNLRVKTETLVAGGGDGFITGDSADDTILPDS